MIKFKNYVLDENKLRRNYLIEPIHKNGKYYDESDFPSKKEFRYIYEVFFPKRFDLIEFLGVNRYFYEMVQKLYKISIRTKQVVYEEKNGIIYWKKYKIELSKVGNRNWLKDPLYKGPTGRYLDGEESKNITPEILKYLYLDLNMRIEEVNEFFNANVESFICEYKICKSTELRFKLTEETNLKKYGAKCVLSSQIIKDQIKETNLKKYGSENPFGSDKIKDKVKQTNVMRYGSENPFASEIIKDRIKETCLKRYGAESYASSKRCNYDKDCKRYGKETANILINKELFRKELEKYGKQPVSFFAEKLNVTPYTILKYMDIYDCRNEFIDSFRSNGEIEILNFLTDELNIPDYEISKNERRVIREEIGRNKPMELDFYIPKYKLAIEYNGSYWHSTKASERNAYRHKLKTDKCEKKGIRLIHVFDYEWELKRDKIKNLIKNVIQDNKIIYARKCEVKEISNEDARNFLDLYHLQGNCYSKVKLGLFCGDELLEVMTFSKPRFSKKADWELIRLCTKNDYTVIGGASKLLKYFEKKHNPKSLISYCDRAHFEGKIYEKLGFTLDCISKPNYVWVNNACEILTRYQTQKHVLVKEGYDKNKSEREIMEDRNFYQVFDAGNSVWIKKYTEE